MDLSLKPELKSSSKSDLQADDIRIAWAVPSIQAGAYFGPIIRECHRLFKETIFFTGKVWPKFKLTDPGAQQIHLVGRTKFVESVKIESGYSQGFIAASPAIALELAKYRPDIIIASAFSLWTLIALLLKPIYRWRVVVVYDGFSPNTSFSANSWRSRVRVQMAAKVDAFIANSQGANYYLTQILNVPDDKIVHYPYLMPDFEALQSKLTPASLSLPVDKTVFIFVGRLIERKGIRVLLEACHQLKQQGRDDFTLLVIGEGEQKSDLQAFAKEKGLAAQTIWTGWVDYRQLGSYLQQADVFVFPTYEDVWGMVVPEAMACGTPVICSEQAGAKEMIEPGESGYLFEPEQPEALASLMQKFIDCPGLANEMGVSARETVTQYSPTATAKTLAKLATDLLSKP